VTWRAWSLDLGPGYAVRAGTREDVIAAVVDDYRGGEEPAETYWIWVAVVTPQGEESELRVPVHPIEPDCTAREHKWRHISTHLNGGGVVIEEVCSACGLLRRTDTWATDPGSGMHGRAIRYMQPA